MTCGRFNDGLKLIRTLCWFINVNLVSTQQTGDFVGTLRKSFSWFSAHHNRHSFWGGCDGSDWTEDASLLSLWQYRQLDFEDRNDGRKGTYQCVWKCLWVSLVVIQTIKKKQSLKMDLFFFMGIISVVSAWFQHIILATHIHAIPIPHR